MGSESLVYPAVRTERASRSHYHPYHFTDSFDKLRQHLPAAISVGCYTESVIDQPWNYQHATAVAPYMHPPYFPNGQDTNHHSFAQGASPYFMPTYDSEAKFNEDLDVGSFSGDDDVEEYDSNAQLRSQQLNSDGTPKRPMNAFMIFARKRRPMVSSEQPTMRTGEISKILSKEWSEMKKEDKQFYLDQAKKLKDTFNTRWPDYVYRRRPNNSRKRRKAGGASSVGPARSHDATNNSDSHAEALADSNASGQSGDESRSQSTDTFPSPLSQHNLIYHTPELSQSGSLDRSPTPAGTLSAYTAPVTPYISGHFDGPVFNGFAQQVHSYGENGDGYYGGCIHISGHVSAPQHNSRIETWRSRESEPSGVVAIASSTPPIPTPLIPSQELHLQPAYPPHEHSSWSKGTGSDAQCYEAQPTIWGSTTSISAHHGADSRGPPPSLPPPMNLSGPNALGMHPYGDHKGPFNENPCHPPYVEVNHTNQGYRPSMNLPPFRDEFPSPHDSSTYLGSRHWTPGEEGH
ncbi:Sex-determining region Y protein OS=Alces alces cameloides GN=SRY PE=3 SV=1 [Rhizoctonia solani AG-1 IB]|uniref:Sex-determining region Y protein n=1 Tax=Thanatephorus cucumeris (strain AG1-IB / isolate 7/3/14) TaxID=1108050 RepID=A0A0B7F944_THACB|nr:Sex-determining region Y protein OS=Alces alces cameloides GN=SRY PE=3 SV=1 [Rhizoctonia solani AG-1 IB]